MKRMRKIIEIDEDKCNGCGLCVPSCAEGAIQVVDGKARLMAEKYCDGLGTCLGKCPQDAIQLVEKEVDEFDEDAAPATTATDSGKIPSALSHWPVQIRLVPPHAPFLKNADLLIAADCSPLAYGDFHRDFLTGRVVMMGCPKFDDTDLYEKRFRQIFQKAGVKSVTILVMEVPCCRGLPAIVKKVLRETPSRIPLEVVTISLQGKILERAEAPFLSRT